MPQVTVVMNTLDLRDAAHTPVTGRHVWKLQAMLNVWLRSFHLRAGQEPAALLATDGVAGPLTLRELTSFQNAAEVAPDAVVGPMPWEALMEFDLPEGWTAAAAGPRVASNRTAPRTGSTAPSVRWSYRYWPVLLAVSIARPDSAFLPVTSVRM